MPRGLPPPRAIAALERRLGVLLLQQRSTRSVRLSEAGERFVLDCRRILAELDEAENAAAGVQGEAQGLPTLTAPQIDVRPPACGAAGA